MPYVDRPLPEALELPRLREARPRDKRLDNLRQGPGIGRVKGVQNKICRDLKEGCLEAAINVGRDGNGLDGLVGFLEDLARNHKRAFTSLLVKMLPMQLTADVNKSTINEVRIISVPAGGRLSPEQMERVQAGEPFVIDHVSQQEHAPQPEPASDPAPQSEEEVIDSLKREINKLAQKAGVSLVV
jgi:hypothetical protein